MLADSAVQLSTRKHFHIAKTFTDLTNTKYSKAHSLAWKPYLAIITSNEASNASSF